MWKAPSIFTSPKTHYTEEIGLVTVERVHHCKYWIGIILKPELHSEHMIMHHYNYLSFYEFIFQIAGKLYKPVKQV